MLPNDALVTVVVVTTLVVDVISMVMVIAPVA